LRYILIWSYWDGLLKFREVPLIAGAEARRILSFRDVVGEVEVSLDLGISKTVCRVYPDGVELAGRVVEWETLEKIAENPEDVYVLGRKIRKLSFYKGAFYRLVLPCWGHAPTVEINGVRMHRTVGTHPEVDAWEKTRLAGVLRGRKVLDLCTGLGYTAVSCAKRGCSRVVTVEKDVNVLRLAAYNPWSRDLFKEPIEIVVEDAYLFLQRCDEVFNAVIHDPPAIYMEGKLYSEEFYRLVAKVLKRGGVLVHYVGETGRRRGVRLHAGVMKRLHRAGFVTEYHKNLRCVRAVKI
jgi:uncharacterized protein